MQELRLGAKVEYTTPKGGKAKGVVHAVNKHEDAKGNVTAITYLIDTGKNASENIVVANPRNEAVSELVDKYIADGMDITAALQKAEKHPDLPQPSKDKQVVVRQPEQVQVGSEHVTAL